jgi:kinesin family protein C2/C3
VCIFAYGQTGSGKTFTMDGPDSNPGLNRRALAHLFEVCQVAKRPRFEGFPEIKFCNMLPQLVTSSFLRRAPFQVVEEKKGDWTFEIEVSVLEIYNEILRDLLGDPKLHKKGLDIRHGKEGPNVPGLSRHPVSNAAEVRDYFKQAQKVRATSSTKMNEVRRWNWKIAPGLCVATSWLSTLGVDVTSWLSIYRTVVLTSGFSLLYRHRLARTPSWSSM